LLKAIEAKGKVERCYDMLKARVSGFGGEPLVVKVGFRGGGGEETVIWIEPYDLWHELSESWWNAFGVGRPVLRGSNSITCEINFAGDGVDRRTGGLFAEDDAGNIYVLHRGRIGGGRKNIGKTGFIRSFTGELVEVADGGRTTKVVPVASLKSTNFLAQLSFFVHEVARYKKDAVINARYVGTVATDAFYVPRYKGRWARGAFDAVESSFEHGLVTCTLANILSARGALVRSDSNHDLYVRRGSGRVGIVFEVETSPDLSHIYNAVGRLFLYSSSGAVSGRKFVVAPRSTSEDIEERLKKLRIKLIRYRITEGRVSFSPEKFLRV